MSDNTFSIYQLKEGNETRSLRFEQLGRLKAAGLAVSRENYDLVYTAPLEGMTLNDIYMRFNIHRPEDFKSHSLSMSDIVVLRQHGTEKAYYVDNIGFRDVPQFFTGAGWSENEQREAQTQYIGKWEESKRTPDVKRLTWWHPDFGVFVAKDFVSHKMIADRYAEIMGAKSRAIKTAPEKKPMAEQLKEAAKQAGRGDTPPPDKKKSHNNEDR